MKECLKCGFKLPDTDNKCRFCGGKLQYVQQPDAPKPAQQQPYAQCNVCGFKLAATVQKCPYCGGLCKQVGVDVDNTASTQKTEREQLLDMARELKLDFPKNISNAKLKELIRAAQTPNLDKDLSECSEAELRTLAADVGCELSDDDDAFTIAAKLTEFLTDNGNGNNDDSGNSQTSGATGK